MRPGLISALLLLASCAPPPGEPEGGEGEGGEGEGAGEGESDAGEPGSVLDLVLVHVVGGQTCVEDFTDLAADDECP